MKINTYYLDLFRKIKNMSYTFAKRLFSTKKKYGGPPMMRTYAKMFEESGIME